MSAVTVMTLLLKRQFNNSLCSSPSSSILAVSEESCDDCGYIMGNGGSSLPSNNRKLKHLSSSSRAASCLSHCVTFDLSRNHVKMLPSNKKLKQMLKSLHQDPPAEDDDAKHQEPLNDIKINNNNLSLNIGSGVMNELVAPSSVKGILKNKRNPHKLMESLNIQKHVILNMRWQEAKAREVEFKPDDDLDD